MEGSRQKRLEMSPCGTGIESTSLTGMASCFALEVTLKSGLSGLFGLFGFKGILILQIGSEFQKGTGN
jgi:hypothetical protein